MGHSLQKPSGFWSLLYNLRDHQLSIGETKASEAKVLALSRQPHSKIPLRVTQYVSQLRECLSSLDLR